MALRFYGDSENDLGEWFDFGLDAAFRLRIRRVSTDVNDLIDRRHQGKQTFEVRDGIRRPIQDLQPMVDALTDKAVWAWTDAEGLEVEAGDEGAAKFFKCKVSETVALKGGSLTAEVKRRLINERPYCRVKSDDEVDDTGAPKVVDQQLGFFILAKAAELQRAFSAKKAGAEGNS